MLPVLNPAEQLQGQVDSVPGDRRLRWGGWFRPGGGNEDSSRGLHYILTSPQA